jgi:hypothetical protein
MGMCVISLFENAHYLKVYRSWVKLATPVGQCSSIIFRVAFYWFLPLSAQVMGYAGINLVCGVI